MSQEMAQRVAGMGAVRRGGAEPGEGSDEMQNAVHLGVEVHGVLFVLVAALWGGPAGAGDGLLSRDLAIGVPSAL